MGTPISIATPRLPVDNKLYYLTMPMKRLSSSGMKIQGGLSVPNVSIIFSLHTHTHTHTHTRVEAELCKT